MRSSEAADSIDEDQGDRKEESIVDSRTFEKTLAEEPGCPKQEKKQIGRNWRLRGRGETRIFTVDPFIVEDGRKEATVSDGQKNENTSGE